MQWNSTTKSHVEVTTGGHSLEKDRQQLLYIPYTAKLSRRKTFAVVHKTHYSLENFRGASGLCHYVLYTESDSRGKLLQKTAKVFPLKVLPYTVVGPESTLSCLTGYSGFTSRE